MVSVIFKYQKSGVKFRCKEGITENEIIEWMKRGIISCLESGDVERVLMEGEDYFIIEEENKYFFQGVVRRSMGWVIVSPSILRYKLMGEHFYVGYKELGREEYVNICSFV
jgi:hypothetical protein